MASTKMSTLPALRRQHLLAEFAGLKQACPDGVFMSLTPGDPALWSGVIFVRKGPYETAILRFQISFPDTYPRLPPLVTFSTDIFHPLITPLTTYMYTTDIHDNGTVSATDEERLPPGGFSLRHGFPDWFGRGGGRKRPGQSGSRVASGSSQLQTPPRPSGAGASHGGTPASNLSSGGGPQRHLQTEIQSEEISTYEVLRYIASTFDDAAVLDSVPLEAAGNPGAWHAWKTRQSEAASSRDRTTSPSGTGGSSTPKTTQGVPLSQELGADDVPEAGSGAGARRPGEWNWEGVWEERVKRGIAASLSEPVLFGNAGGAADDVIRFINMEKDDVETARKNLLKTLGPSVTSQ
ncbi:hypothetical protein MCOR25_000687 [Pyricularia grisea]|uniref:UBC core domain-containing protein n=1 Tax=Pyricularia grisea TaxID=148305 RepID=A0A6P8BBW2_PYRGI|nr:uncharacterized protein PgNI_04025 [Pyricularia grisea]KAI6382389.1 hypothetical protein MCOR25_000687 [Pyricularia grisea]TLD13172.1 hypothetical protein PgNI_04025 [Pyricularia grisea]